MLALLEGMCATAYYSIGALPLPLRAARSAVALGRFISRDGPHTSR